MNILTPEQFVDLTDELNEFVVLCRDYNYTPRKDEFDEMIKFILLYHGGGASHLCESYENNKFNLLDNLYENYGFDINEATISDPEADYDSAVGTATSAVKGAAKGAAAVAGLAVGGIIGVGAYIKYLFKKSKVKKSISKEFDIEKRKLDGWIKLQELKNKLSELKSKGK